VSKVSDIVFFLIIIIVLIGGVFKTITTSASLPPSPIAIIVIIKSRCQRLRHSNTPGRQSHRAEAQLNKHQSVNTISCAPPHPGQIRRDEETLS
jgi:hypothetical protein